MPRYGTSPTQGRRAWTGLAAGLVLLGLLLAIGHVSAASLVEHADCAVCKVLHHVDLAVLVQAAVQAGVVVAALAILVRAASGRTPLTRRGRAPPRFSPV